MEAEPNSLLETEGALPQAAYQLTDQITREDLRLLYVQLIEELNQENAIIPSFGTLHKMMLERAAFMYVFQRQKEDEAMDARTMKELIQTWTGTVAEIYKQARLAMTEDELRMKIVGNVIAKLNTAIDQQIPDKDMANSVKINIAELLYEAHI